MSSLELDKKYMNRGDKGKDGDVEYNELYKLITNTKPVNDSPNAMYDELMQKEARLLETVDRVIEDRAEERRREKTFMDTPIKKMPLEFLRSVKGMFEDLQEVSDMKALWAIIYKDKRMIYGGILLIIVATFLMLIQVSGNDVRRVV